MDPLLKVVLIRSSIALRLTVTGQGIWWNPLNHTTNYQSEPATWSPSSRRTIGCSLCGRLRTVELVVAKKRRGDYQVLFLSSDCLRWRRIGTRLSANSVSSSNYCETSTARPSAADSKSVLPFPFPSITSSSTPTNHILHQHQNFKIVHTPKATNCVTHSPQS